MKTHSAVRSGFALGTVMVLSLIMLAAVGSMLGFAINESRSAHQNQLATEAFHLAEKGIELAIDSLARADFASWTTNATTQRRTQSVAGIHTGAHTGSIIIIIDPVSGSANSFVIQSRGTAVGGAGLSSQRAIRTEVATTTNASTGKAPLEIGDDVVFGFSKPPCEVYTYNAAGTPTKNYLAKLADPSLTLNNVKIAGKMETATGAELSYKKSSDCGTGETPFSIRNDSSTNDLDMSLISNGYTFNHPTPTIPSTIPAAREDHPNNYQPGAGGVQWGTDGGTTRVNVGISLNSDPNTVFTIRGTVYLTVAQTVNLKGRLRIENGGKLICYINDSNAAIDLACSGFTPDQFIVNITSPSYGTVVVHTEDHSSATPKSNAFIGTINAPRQKVNLHACNGDTPRDTFDGYLTAKGLEVTNGPIIKAPDTNGGGSGTTTVTIGKWYQVRPSTVSL